MAEVLVAPRDGPLLEDPRTWLGTLTYRSEACGRPSPAALRELVAQARVRNRRLGITGMLLFEDGRFLQVLEGPPESLDAVWSSIARDPRHRRIEVLNRSLLPVRIYAGWDMQFFARSGHSRPAAPVGERELAAEQAEAVRLARRDAAEELAGRLIALVGQGLAPAEVVGRVLEPAARALGDLWLRDEVTDLELTIALGTLQRAGHGLHLASARPPVDRTHRPCILLASAPGEPHLTGPALLADLFDEAGWDAALCFPQTDDELVGELLALQPEALDIGLSEAMPRARALGPLAETVRRCRAAWPDDGLVVSVGGRLFAEGRAHAADVGADVARRGLTGAVDEVARRVEHHRLVCACGRQRRLPI
ncbi:MAG: BLUF domain-containing protein [Thermaurantiacus sp.]|uniref:BLUF domain-containing protein n=1 Tax=Thermaurantiacus sp. TaxID=2820283 RepID=UPI00298F31FE|nr:BLUF domain-containing protein [Thermaurantiacus sp.]MDW8414643.1 BLUF domain-containing protein [Thermaurantiacus sp.]